jgi:hypothetical protein
MDPVFLVATHGWSGSNWLAWTLGRHPALACSHGVMVERRPHENDGDEAVWYSGLHAPVRERNQRRYEVPLDDTFAQIAQLAPGLRCGNVGYFRARDFPILLDRLGPNSRPARWVNLVRHPVSVVWSGFGQFRKRFRFDIYELQWNLSKVIQYAMPLLDELERDFGVERGDRDTLAFVAAALALSSLDLDVRALDAVRSTDALVFGGNVRLEDITTDPAALAGLLAALAPGAEPEPGWLAEATSGRRVNVHNPEAIDDPAAKWGRFAPWQQRAFSWALGRTKIRAFYEALGYPLGFVP